MPVNPINPFDAHNDEKTFDRVFISRDQRLNMHHTVGERLPADLRLTATEAFERAGMMWNIKRIADGAKFGNEVIQTGQYQLWQMPTKDGEKPVFLGYAGEDYVPMQNRQLAHWLDQVADEYPVESAGYLRGANAAAMIVFSGMQWDIRVAPRKKDELQDRLVVVNPMKVGTSVTFSWMSTAFWCTNQLYNWLVRNEQAQLGSGASNNRDGVLRLRHNNNVNASAQYVTEKLALAARNEDERHEFIQYTANKPLDAGQRNAVIKAAYPEPKRPQLTATVENALALAGEEADQRGKVMVEQGERNHDNLRKRNAARREAVELSLEERGIGGSAYAVMNAIVEVEEWRTGQRADNDVIAMDMISGDRAAVVSRALDVAKKFL